MIIELVRLINLLTIRSDPVGGGRGTSQSTKTNLVKTFFYTYVLFSH